MFYSLVTGFQTLRLMKDILRQNQLSDMAPRVLLVLVVPAQPPLWPSPPCPWPRTPFQPSLGHPDLTGAMPEECWSPALPHGWTSDPCCSLVSSTVSVLAFFFAPDWTLWMDSDPGSSLAVPGATDGPWHQLDVFRPCRTALVGKGTEEDPSFSSLVEQPQSHCSLSFSGQVLRLNNSGVV